MTVVRIHKPKREAADKFKRRSHVRSVQASILHIAVCSSFGFNADSWESVVGYLGVAVGLVAIGLLWSASGRWAERGGDISALCETGMVLVKESELMTLPGRYVTDDPKKEALLN